MVSVSALSGLFSAASPSPPYVTTIRTPMQHGKSHCVRICSLSNIRSQKLEYVYYRVVLAVLAIYICGDYPQTTCFLAVE